MGRYLGTERNNSDNRVVESRKQLAETGDEVNATVENEPALIIGLLAPFLKVQSIHA